MIPPLPERTRSGRHRQQLGTNSSSNPARKTISKHPDGSNPKRNSQDGGLRAKPMQPGPIPFSGKGIPKHPSSASSPYPIPTHSRQIFAALERTVPASPLNTPYSTNARPESSRMERMAGFTIVDIGLLFKSVLIVQYLKILYNRN